MATGPYAVMGKIPYLSSVKNCPLRSPVYTDFRCFRRTVAALHLREGPRAGSRVLLQGDRYVGVSIRCTFERRRN